MSKLALTGLALPLFLLFMALPQASALKALEGVDKKAESLEQTGTLQKMIVESGGVTIDLDLNQLNVIRSAPQKPVTLQFDVAANSFFSVLVFNDSLRGAEQGSMALIPENGVIPLRQGYGGQAALGYSQLPVLLAASIKQLAVEKLAANDQFDLAVRDTKTGFTFFNIEGHQYNYDPKDRLLNIAGGKLLISKEFAKRLGLSADVVVRAGKISISAVMQPVEISEIVNGEKKSVTLPPLNRAVGGETPQLVPGPDVIVGDLPQMAQSGHDAINHLVGIGIATTSCNNGTEPLHWLALPQTDHPVIPQNLYRMSGDRFEQIGQSWMKHAFLALENNACGFGCNTSGCTTGSNLCSGCSDPYSASLNADQNSIGSRAWVNPFTGSFPSNANDHSGHSHTATSHRVTVASSDLDPAQNPGAMYFAEAQYVTPHEYAWCQSHPGECNMNNNASYRQFTVSGSGDNYTFLASGPTTRMQPAIIAWAATGATVAQYQPDSGNDGVFFVGYKVTGPDNGVWHYEYAIYNENLDRGIQSFSVPFGFNYATLSNIGFHEPPQEPGWANDGTFNNQGYSSTPWIVTQGSTSITWNSETFAQNQNANAIRFGTLYNFRFDADRPPTLWYATIGFFKNGGSVNNVVVAAPVLQHTPTVTPTATATATPQSTPIDSPTPRPTDTPTVTATPTATAAATVTPTATSTVSPTATPSGTPPCIVGWSAGQAFPSVQVRSVGVYFFGGLGPRFYAIGGRSADAAGSDFTHPFEYTLFSNTWVTKTATYPDNQVSNMACGVLTVSGTQLIYCVGGSAAGATTATGRVFFYNPETDTITTLTGADDWPGAEGTIVPGGFSVFNDKLYILGGFNINVGSTNQIWQFDPTAAVGSKWLQRVNTPVGIMYAPTATIGNAIYVGGASDYQGGTVIDTTNSFKFDPVANTTSSITAIPRATGETRGLAFNGKMLVMGGGRVAPNPSNEVDAYDPATNTWSVNIPVPAFMTARRNFATDTGPIGFFNGHGIWLAGGYAPTSPTDSTEVFCSGLTPTATPTATFTPPTPTPTTTSTPPTPTATVTSTPSTPTPTATATSTPRPTPTVRPEPSTRPRPTPAPRP